MHTPDGTGNVVPKTSLIFPVTSRVLQYHIALQLVTALMGFRLGLECPVGFLVPEHALLKVHQSLDDMATVFLDSVLRLPGHLLEHFSPRVLPT